MTKLDVLARRLVLCWALAAGCGRSLASESEPPAAAETATPSTAPPAPPDAAPSPGAPALAAAPDPVIATAIQSAIARDLARFAAVASTDRPWLVVSGADASGCYVHPCPAANSNSALLRDYAAQLPRLGALTDLAARVAAAEQAWPAATDTSADIDGLNGLRILTVGSLLSEARPTTGNCYSLPCADDLAAVDADNQRRAAVLHEIAVEATAQHL